MIRDDGDIIRGLGFVTLYAAYLEEQIDNLLFILDKIAPYDEAKQRWPISRKIKHAIKVLKTLDAGEFPDLAEYLRTCLDLYEDRNELLHGRIYGNFDRTDTLKSGRPNIPDREIESSELYELANKFDDFSAAIIRPMIFKIPNALAKYLAKQVG